MGNNYKDLLGVLKGRKSLVAKSLLIVGAGIATAIGLNALKSDDDCYERFSDDSECAVIDVEFTEVEEPEEIKELSNEETEEE